jgi:glycosyltransferase involved in cell wall biosynthesis
MDKLMPKDYEIMVLINQGQVPYLPVENISLEIFPDRRKNIFKRLLWVHVQLPLWCYKKRINLMHKVATETPWFCSAKRVTTIHDFYYEYLIENHPSAKIRVYEKLENAYFNFTTKLCFKKSVQFIAVSEATKLEAVRRYPKCNNRISTIYHGACIDQYLNEEVFLYSSMEGRDKPIFNILCVAKFMEHKGQHLLINAFEQLLENHEDLRDRVKLSLRGFQNDYQYFKQIKRMIKNSPFSASIEIILYDASETLSDIYESVDLVVLLSDYEGFGLPILEAQLFGIPVLCSAIDVLKEVGGDGALYVNRENLDQIKNNILNLILDRDFYKDMRLRALENVKKFSWVNAAQETLGVYESVLESSEI